MSVLENMKLNKKTLEERLAALPIMTAFWKLFIIGNLILGVTSGAFNRAFYMILKLTDFKHIYFWYGVRYIFYFWVVFIAGFSLILMLQRIAELPRWAAGAVCFYIAVSFFCLGLFENFMPFQLVGSEAFDIFYKAMRY